MGDASQKLLLKLLVSLSILLLCWDQSFEKREKKREKNRVPPRYKKKRFFYSLDFFCKPPGPRTKLRVHTTPHDKTRRQKGGKKGYHNSKCSHKKKKK
ncbi:hypothetical protein DFP73DRAFT_275391 [Morchella snyderi]|nr:hypothetical protein DFP73DRAFT_275391 [Morchella snyderi]